MTLSREPRPPEPPAPEQGESQADGYGGDIKIGISRDPIARLGTLQVGSSIDLRGIAAWPGFLEEEKALHTTYAYAHIRGEWFGHHLPMYHYLVDRGGTFRWTR